MARKGLENILKVMVSKIIKIKLRSILLVNGKGATSEKLIRSTLKNIQKQNFKNYMQNIIIAIVKAVLPFKVSQKEFRKGKQKKTITISCLLTTDSARIASGLKHMKKVMSSSNNFVKRLSSEVSSCGSSESFTVQNRDKIHRQVSSNKRYIKNFRW